MSEVWCIVFFFFQAEDGIRDLVRSRGLGDVYKRQHRHQVPDRLGAKGAFAHAGGDDPRRDRVDRDATACLLYTSDAADERSSVDLGGRRIIKKKTTTGVLNIYIIHYKHTQL